MPFQQRIEGLILAPIDNGRASFNEFQPAMYQQVSTPLWDDFDIAEWKLLGILHLLRHDKCLDAVQCFYLPVNMQHLWL